MSEASERKKRKLVGEGNGSASILSEAPREIKIVEFAESRATEIEALSRSCETLGGAKRLFQTLPRHMRRRAMSHNVKRLPRRLRDQAAKEYEAKAQKKEPSKRPSRRYRRRPKNLLSEYSRRQRSNVWLETHIWHAKRFKMADQWGYRIPIRPSEKSSRASYRASAKHCLLQDISYHCCVELSGPEGLLLDGLSHVTDSKAGKTFAAKAFLDGSREGCTMMYCFQTYPYNVIGPVSFLWKPIAQSEFDSDLIGSKLNQPEEATDLIGQRQLWIWCHPSCYKQVWSELCRAFSLLTSESVSNQDAESPKAIVQNNSVSNNSIKLTSLKDSLIRYRLSGPLSQAILSDLLKEAVVSKEIKSEHENFWWQDYYKNKTTHAQQWRKWNIMKTSESPAELPPHFVLALTVRDPRIFLPPKKKMVTVATSSDDLKNCNTTKEPVGSSMLCGRSPELAFSPLWLSDIRKRASEKLTEQEINQLRSQLLIPGSVLNLGERESRIPVLLIQRPGHQVEPLQSRSKNANIVSGFSSGWDIILPSGWGMAFWVSLVYRGARVGGTREAENLHQELGKLYFPSDFPDTDAGKMHEDMERKALEEKHLRYPPAKRPNFVKFGSPTPFYFPWIRILREWREDSISSSSNKNKTNSDESSPMKVKYRDNFFVLRERTLLQELSTTIFRNVLKETCLGDAIQSPRFLENLSYALVSVRVTMVNRGTPEKFASICLATEEDLRKLEENKDYGGPVEPPHKDLSKETTTGERKKKGVGQTESNTEEPKKGEESLLDFNSRKTIGYLISGAFSFCRGHGAGLGFCSAIGLSHIKRLTVCLVRPQNSHQYRFVRLEMII